MGLVFLLAAKHDGITFANLLSVVALLIAGLSLYFSFYVNIWRARTKLTLEPFDNNLESSDAQILDTNLKAPATPQQCWVRLKVTSAARRNAAEDTEVMVVEARATAGPPTLHIHIGEAVPETRDRSHPIPIEGQLLTWANTNFIDFETGVRNPRVTRLHLPPGIHRYIDLLCITRAEVERGCQVQVFPPPSDDRNDITDRAFELDLALTARNADARRYLVNVSFDGTWGDRREDVRQHFAVTVREAAPRSRELTDAFGNPSSARNGLS